MGNNINRFPDDFIFKLTNEEYDALRSQIVTLNNPKLVSQIVTPSKFTLEELFLKN